MMSEILCLHHQLEEAIEDLECREKILREALEDIINLRSGPEYIASEGAILEGSSDDEWQALLDVPIDRAKKALEEAGMV